MSSSAPAFTETIPPFFSSTVMCLFSLFFYRPSDGEVGAVEFLKEYPGIHAAFPAKLFDRAVVTVMLVYAFLVTIYLTTFLWMDVSAGTIPIQEALLVRLVGIIPNFFIIMAPIVRLNCNKHISKKKFLSKSGWVLVICNSIILITVSLPFFFGWSKADISSLFISIIGLAGSILFLNFVTHAEFYTYDPCRYQTDLYLYCNVCGSGKADISIKDWGSFAIELRNEGIMLWLAKGHKIKRATYFPWAKWLRFLCFHRELKYEVEIPLPDDLQILPGETVTLIPETSSPHEKCHRIRGLRCFGYGPAHEIRTQLIGGEEKGIVAYNRKIFCLVDTDDQPPNIITLDWEKEMKRTTTFCDDTGYAYACFNEDGLPVAEV